MPETDSDCQGWNSKAGDEYFAQQRAVADFGGPEQQLFFFGMMQRIGEALNKHTGAFTSILPGDHDNILDLCMAPGGMLLHALEYNPNARATAFTLPVQNGGHAICLSEEVRERVSIRLKDITLLAADMGVTTIPEGHADHSKFILEKQLDDEQLFDIILCDGQVLRTHTRAEYRDKCEARRLLTTQLVLGLEHIEIGGMLVSQSTDHSWRR